jgi:hypothetical protein
MSRKAVLLSVILTAAGIAVTIGVGILGILFTGPYSDTLKGIGLITAMAGFFAIAAILVWYAIKVYSAPIPRSTRRPAPVAKPARRPAQPRARRRGTG